MIVAVLAVAAAPAVGEGAIACAPAACLSTVSVDVDGLRGEGRVVTVCIDRTCQRATSDEPVGVIRRYRKGQRVAVRVVVRTDRGRVLGRVRRTVALKRRQLEAPICPDTCWSRSLRWDEQARMLRAD